MGVFNTIKTDEKCPNCHQPVEWQSKRLIYDGIIVGNLMQALTLNKRMDGEMHAYCDACETWFDATIEKGKVVTIKPSNPIRRLQR